MSDEWTEQDARAWLDQGFTWLKEQWQEDPDRGWRELESGLLAALGVSDKENNVVVAALFTKVEEKDDDDGIYEMFTTEEQETELVDHLLGVWREDQASQAEEVADDTDDTDNTDDQVDTTKPYWDGERWLEYDEASGEWVPSAGDGSPASDQDSEQTAEQDAESEDVAAEPEQASADIVEKIAAPALAEAMANSAAVRDLSNEERDALLGEVVAARMATR